MEGNCLNGPLYTLDQTQRSYVEVGTPLLQIELCTLWIKWDQALKFKRPQGGVNSQIIHIQGFYFEYDWQLTSAHIQIFP